MKTFRLFIFFFLLPLTFYGQKTLTGLWAGTYDNDSSTIRKDQSFEIALTQYKEKVYGYSRSTFIVNDTLYYILKRVKGTIDGDICAVKDDEIISYNFRGRIDKGVKVTTTLRMNRQDSTWYLTGNWSTNKTKRFYAISGKVTLQDEPDLEKSKILPHLEELNLAQDIPFYVEAKKQAQEINKPSVVAKKEEPVLTQAVPPASKAPVQQQEPTGKPVAKTTKTEITGLPVKQEQKNSITRQEPDQKEKPVQKPAEPIVSPPAPTQQEPVAMNKPVEKRTSPAPEQKNTGREKASPVQKKKPTVKKDNDTPIPPKQEPVAITRSVEKDKGTENSKEDSPVSVVAHEPQKPQAVITENKASTGVAALASQRKTTPPQEVNFKSDSLQLALYDNGEIDGDTVSVLLNGNILLLKQGLKASAIKKTIYIEPGTDEVILVLFAENLGKYAPNTGLLVVYDGEERYQVRFSADLQQNASVIFRRKK